MHLPAGRAVGCKKVKLLEPKVRLARFHNESFPSLRGREEVAVSSCSEVRLGDLSSEDILILPEMWTRNPSTTLLVNTLKQYSQQDL